MPSHDDHIITPGYLPVLSEIHDHTWLCISGAIYIALGFLGRSLYWPTGGILLENY